MKLAKHHAIAIFVFLFSIAGMSQTALLNFYEFPGSRARAMGGAWTALANDATAMAWNPARLTKVKRGHAMISGYSVNQGTGFKKFDASNLLLWNIDQKDNTDFQFAGLVWPYSNSADNTHVGLGIVRHVLMPANQLTTLRVPQSTSWSWDNRTEGHVTSVIAAIGVDVYRNISLGMSMDFIYGEEIFNSSFLQSGIHKDTLNQNETHQYTGTAFSFAVNVADISGFDLGMNFHFPHLVDRDRSINRSELRFPFFFEMGIAGKIYNDVLLSLQFLYRPWNRVDIKTGPDIIFYTPDALHAYGLGIEYPMHLGSATWKFRSGYRYKPFLSGIGNNPAIFGHVFSLGGSFVTKWYDMSFALIWETYQHSFRNYALNSTFTLANVEQRWNRLLFSIDLGVKLVH